MRRILAAILFCVAAPFAAAQPAVQPPIEGSFALDTRASDSIDQAINDAIRDMNWVARQVARTRLRRINDPYTTVSISQNGPDVVVVFQGRSVASPASGEEIQWRRETGEVLGVSTRWRGHQLEQTFTAEDGKRTNLFALNPSGDTLSVRVTMSSERLTRPLTYTLRYQRRN
jgi:hypothetical protein